MTMPHPLVVALDLAGAADIPAGFTSGQTGRLDQPSVTHLIRNLTGSSDLAAIAFVDQRWGFLLLEGVWSIVSAVSLIDVLRSGGRSARR